MQIHDTTRACVVCSKSFTYVNPKQIYCSRACLKRVARQKQIQKLLSGQCKYCGASFRPQSDRPRRFCSKQCANRDRYQSDGHRTKVIIGFWRRVEQTATCWIWHGYQHPSGYGVVSIQGIRIMAHRFAYELTYGRPPDDLRVCHHCDNPSCVRPEHLFLGTAADNAADMVRKDRQSQGERKPSAKLTPEIVRAIRSSALGVRELARLHGVCHKTVSDIIHHRKWRQVL